jgi:VanZ family protein
MAISRKWYRCGALVLAVGVSVISSWPSLKTPEIGWSAEDKILHLLVYSLLAYLAFRGWLPSDGPLRVRRTIWVILLILACFAAADEYHQRWIPGRFVEWGDFLADGLGVLVGFLVAFWQGRRQRPPAPETSPPGPEC